MIRQSHCWGVYPQKTIIRKATYTPTFIATLFTIAKTWKQPKCPQTEESTKKMWYIHRMEYQSSIKKNKIMPFAETWMDLETIILREGSQRKTNMISHVESKEKMIQMNLLTTQKQTHSVRKQTYG